MPCRVLIAAEGSRGDVEPALAMALALREAGHEIVASGPADFSASAARVGIEFRASGPSSRSWMNRYVESIVAGRTNEFFLAYHQEIVPQQQATLAELIPKFDLVMGAGLQLAAQPLCAQLGVRYGYVLYCPQFLRALSLTAPAGASATIFDRPELDLRRVEPLLVAADPVLAPLPEGISLRCRQTGALSLQRPACLDARIESFLQAGPPPVYIGFGSMPEPDADRTTSLLLEAIRLAGCRAVLSDGWLRMAQRELPAGCLTVGEAPHDALFPRMSAVVHHGGAGTTHTAARAGVPQIVIPHFADQFYWGHRVRALGLGPRLIPYPQLGAALLADTLKKTLLDEAMRGQAAQFAVGMRVRSGTLSTVQALHPYLGHG